MDRKQHRIIHCLYFFIVLLFSFLLSGCFLFLIPSGNREDYKKPLLKSISIDTNNIITIILDNTNKSKRLGEIHELKILYRFDILKYEKSDDEIIIRQDISEYKENFVEGNQYRIEICWYGGHLFLETVFQNSQFKVLKEKYIDRI